MIDHLSGAPQSTEFATSRFLVPFLHRKGWCLFTDCDVVFLGDISELFALADSRYAVQVVKHQHNPVESVKMDGQAQTSYDRKNWSSVVLWNCDHPAHHRLTLGMVNWWPGACLHRFCWLKDDEIGSLPNEWNWLVGVQPKPADPKIAHFTLGGPFLPGWTSKEHDDIWLRARDE
jgi:lipopolysaccharide biosynthesis glycosyltransferase